MTEEHPPPTPPSGDDGGGLPKLQLDIPPLLDKAWKVFMEAPSVYAAAGLVFLVAGVVLGVLSAVLGSIPLVGFLLSLALSVAATVVFGLLFVGLLGMARDGIRGGRPKFEEIFGGFGPMLVPTAIASAVIGLLTTVGTMMCLVPGLAVCAVYLHTWRYLLEGERDFWAAMEASRKTVFNDPGTWLLVYVVVLGLSIVGAALCGVGLIVAIPFIALFLSAAYEQHGAAAEDAPVPDIEPMA